MSHATREPPQARGLPSAARDHTGCNRGYQLRQEMPQFRLRGVIDDELSQAVVAYIRGAGLAWPHRSLDAVAAAMGSDTAGGLGPHLKRLADESVYWPIDWNRHDSLSAMEVVRNGLTKAHPELSSEAIEALVWDFSYAHW